MDALVLGRGVSGKAAEKLLCRSGFSTRILSDDEPFPEGEFARVVSSPGIAPTHPWLVEARRRGFVVMSELQLGCEELRRRNVRLLGVTGSKGKSSVVKVVAEGLALAGRRAVACGNYGRPVSDVALEDACDWAVVEVSSFMLETTTLASDAFEAVAILNLQDDHLDRHGSREAYHALKRRLLAFAKKGLDFSTARCGVADREFLDDTYFDNEILATNGAAAIGLMRAAGLGAAAIRRAFAAFEPLPHRMNLVIERGGVRYVDDSKATSIAALAAALRMCAPRPVRLIAGGMPKGDNPKIALADLTKGTKKVYLIGQSAEMFAAAWGAYVDCEICGTLPRAVAAAKREAEKGETVLLSPGTASFDQFQGFGQRGDVFVALVKKEGQRE